MLFVPTTSPKPIVDYLADTITRHLADGPVLWLVSGGSCIPIAFQTATRLSLTALHLDRLTVGLVDERYGAVGHSDSNWAQLEAAGFQLPGATLRPVLNGAELDGAVQAFDELLRTHLGRSYTVGLLGIGADGHTAGLKPHSPALTAEALAVTYDWTDYRRITTTPTALAALDEAVVYAVGEAKWPVLDQLEAQADPAGQPAQVLKAVPKITVFSDRPIR